MTCDTQSDYYGRPEVLAAETQKLAEFAKESGPDGKVYQAIIAWAKKAGLHDPERGINNPHIVNDIIGNGTMAISYAIHNAMQAVVEHIAREMQARREAAEQQATGGASAAKDAGAPVAAASGTENPPVEDEAPTPQQACQEAYWANCWVKQKALKLVPEQPPYGLPPSPEEQRKTDGPLPEGIVAHYAANSRSQNETLAGADFTFERNGEKVTIPLASVKSAIYAEAKMAAWDAAEAQVMEIKTRGEDEVTKSEERFWRERARSGRVIDNDDINKGEIR